jgi:hypothetical protein
MTGKSVGCIVAGVIGAFFLLAVVALLVMGGAGLLYYKQQGAPPTSAPPVAKGPVATPSTGSSGTAEVPSPTPDEQAALEGGKQISWAPEGLSWTVPPGWSKQQETPEILSYKSPGSWDAGWLTVSVSPMPASFPAETSLDALYQQAVDQKQLGKYTEVKWLELDGVKGVQFAEAPPADSSDVQRVQWQAYRTYNGRTELVNLMVHSSGKGFPTHRDALYAVLYSTKVSK